MFGKGTIINDEENFGISFLLTTTMFHLHVANIT